MYQCTLPLDKPAASTPIDAQPGQTIRPEKIPLRLCSQSEHEGLTFSDPALARLRQSNAQPAPNLLHGCVHGMIRDAAPKIRRLKPPPVAARREMLPRTCDETRESRWLDSPDSCCVWP